MLHNIMVCTVFKMQCSLSHLIMDTIDVNLQISRLPACRREMILMTMVMTARTEESLDTLCTMENLEAPDCSLGYNSIASK